MECECGGELVKSPEGFLVCSKCGLVYDDLPLSRKRPRSYNWAEFTKRVHDEEAVPYGPRTEIDWKSLDLDKRDKFRKLNHINKNLESSERRVQNGLNILLKVKNNFSNVIFKSAFKTYVGLAKKKSFTGKSLETVVGACVYYAVRQSRSSMALHQVAINLKPVFGDLPVIKVAAHIRKYVFEFIKEGLLDKLQYQTLDDHLVNYFNEAGLSQEHVMEALDYYDFVKDVIGGKNYASIAGALIYYVSAKEGLGITQSRIGSLFKITDATIRNVRDDLINYLILYDVCEDFGLEDRIREKLKGFVGKYNDTIRNLPRSDWENAVKSLVLSKLKSMGRYEESMIRDLGINHQIAYRIINFFKRAYGKK